MYPWFFGLGCSCPWTFLFDWFTEVWHIAVSRVRVWCRVKNFILPNRWKVHVLIIRYDPERKTSVCLLPLKKKDTMLYFLCNFLLLLPMFIHKIYIKTKSWVKWFHLFIQSLFTCSFSADSEKQVYQGERHQTVEWVFCGPAFRCSQAFCFYETDTHFLRFF